MTQNGTLTSKQHTAIETLLTNPNVTKASETLGIGRSTLQRWLTQDSFKAALQAAEQERLETLNRITVGYALQPVAVLIEIMNDKKAAGSVRVRAAAAFLGILLRYREIVVLESRQSALEEALERKK